MSAVKRYQVFHTARTTGGQMLRGMSDEPKAIHDAAKLLSESGEKGVEIVDSQTGKSYGLQTFAAEHRLR